MFDSVLSLGSLFFPGLAETYPLSPLHKIDKDVGDDEVFMVRT